MSEGLHVNKTIGLCKYIICHYWDFPEINFQFQSIVGSNCHDLIQKVKILMRLQLIPLQQMII